jgi:hypothetical protein
MNCETFDDAVLDLLYGEGDAAVAAEARRHFSSCARCKKVFETLSSARADLSLEELPVPAGLESRILTAAAEARPPRLGFWATVDRFITVAGALAMRPQVAMAALLLLMSGSSLLLLRARPAGPGSVVVTERGAPGAVVAATAVTVAMDRQGTPETYADRAGKADKEKDRTGGPGEARGGDAAAVAAAAPAAPAEPEAAVPMPTATAMPADAATTPVATGTIPESVASDPTFAAAMADYQAKRFDNALRTFDVVESGGGEAAPMAALYAARSLRYGKGCSAALVRYETIPTKYPATPAAQEALWDNAACQKERGSTDRARQLYQALRKNPDSRQRAEQALADLERGSGGVAATGAKAAPAAARKKASKADVASGF